MVNMISKIWSWKFCHSTSSIRYQCKKQNYFLELKNVALNRGGPHDPTDWDECTRPVINGLYYVLPIKRLRTTSNPSHLTWWSTDLERKKQTELPKSCCQKKLSKCKNCWINYQMHSVVEIRIKSCSSMQYSTK